MYLFHLVAVVLGSSLWVVGCVETSIKVVILYPLIDVTELSFLTDVVCNTDPSVAQFTALLPAVKDIPGFPTRCFHEVIRTSVLSHPERFQHIVNSGIARLESFFQDQGLNMYIDTLAAAMEHTDMVWSGPTTPRTEIFTFIDHIIDMLPLRPLVLPFSRSLLEANIKVEDYSTYFLLIVQGCGFEMYEKKYRFDITPTMQCLENSISTSCRSNLPADANAFVSNLVTGTRQSRRQIPQDYETNTDPMCYKKSPHIFGMEGLGVIDAVRRGKESSASSEPPEKDQDRSSAPRIMCFTYSYEVKHEHVAAIRRTWGKRCDGYLAISNISKEEDGIYALAPLKEADDQSEWFEQDSYTRMWTKTQLIFHLIATSALLDEYDYFLLGGDDLYVLVDNLRAFLASERIQALSDQPLYLGRQIEANKYTRFNSGGAGYVLNRAAALVLHRLILSPSGECLSTALSSMEDLFVGKCFLEAGITPIDTHNEVDGREMFHPLSPRQAYLGSGMANKGDENEDSRNPEDWYQKMALSSRTGLECCSAHSISFHYITSPDDLYCLDYLLYQQ